MKLDLGSFAFNSSIGSGGNTPSWGTALGQGNGYKITYEGSEKIILGMTRQYYPKDNVFCPFGKGGKVFSGKETDEMQQAALFREVYVNDKRIDYPFIMIIQEEHSSYHTGRLSIKYSPKICIKNENDVVLYSNEQFIKRVYEKYQISENACWFVYDIDVLEQERLILHAVIVDENNAKVYSSTEERKREWVNLIPKEKKIKFTEELKPTELPASRQQIYYGAPGTGKSYTVKKLTKGKSVVRTTFHPDSDYSTFVGAYKPCTIDVPKRDVTNKVTYENGKEVTEKCIIYEFVPQAFLQAYVKAWMFFAAVIEGEEPKEQHLVIEEINRGNCAQIFGDLFQLLDRNEYGFSDYYIHADKDIQKHLEGLLKGLQISNEVKNTINNIYNEDVSEEDRVDVVDKVISGEIMLLPCNLCIMATMNTSDQSLFPIDSAFKRRWDWVYVPIAKGVDRKSGEEFKWTIVVGTKEYDWWSFLEKINEQIGATTNSEDKKLGFFFCQAKDDEIDAETFVSKVLFYIWNDVFKDYGFDADLFKATDGNPLTFDKFYNVVNGEVVPNLENLQQFLENLGVVGVARDSIGDVDEENEDDDAVGINGNGTSVQKGDKFSINGKGIYGFNETMRQAVQEYVNLHHELSARRVVADWSELGIKLKSEKCFIQTSDEYREWAKNIKDPESRVKEVAVGNDVIYVSTQVQCYDMEDFINKVHSKEREWGIHIEKVQE